jgi:signal recognition particle subunit SRP54
MFEGIQRSLSEALKKLRGRGRLTEANIRAGLQEVRRALLDADVNYNVVEDFIARVTEKSLGQQVLRSIDPSEQIVRIVYDELVVLMRGESDKNPSLATIRFAKDRPTVFMLCGLQGQGKTTTAGKLALTLKGQGRKPLLVAADLQRPAAVDQLQVLGEQIGVPVYREDSSDGHKPNPVEVCRHAVAHAKLNQIDTVILDTAGRLHIADMPMDELKQIDRLVRPDEVYLVCDAMTGQDAVNSAKAFNDALELNGVILTKMDGDARGGAALSIRAVTQVPIKFIGVGEKLDRLEEFRPEGMASRIIGQGDLMDIINRVARVQQEISQEELQKQQEKLAKGDFTLEDFRKQLDQVKKMGSMKEMLAAFPGGLGEMIPEGEDPEDSFRRIQGMIDAMTKEERRNPDIIDLPRRRRIAGGSGIEPHDIKQFLQHFETVRVMMRKVMNMSWWERIRTMTDPRQLAAFMPGAKSPQKKGDTGHRKSPRERAKERAKKRKKR